MPVNGEFSSDRRRKAMQAAKAQVRAKFPDLQEGSSGWYRAVENRYRRIVL